jgi:hypothetical protein
MSDPNPYAPPTAPADGGDRAGLCELVRAWEKLRLIYNGVLLLPGIGVLVLWITRQNLPVAAAILGGILFGIGANVAFMLGPFAMHGYRRKPDMEVQEQLYAAVIAIAYHELDKAGHAALLRENFR